MTKRQAQSVIARAIERGELARPGACPVCDAPTFVCAVVRDLERPIQTVAWACHRCLYASRIGKDLLPRRTRSPRAYTSAVRASSTRPPCAGHTPDGACKRKARYRRGPWPVCGNHLRPEARGPWG